MAKTGVKKDDKEDLIELEGVVVDIARNDIKVQLANGHIITGYLAGKLRVHSIKILIGDKVKVKMSPYDLTKGRIVWRDKD
ncbi:MAG: translation initiation factor IF-1 [Clostridia bacterium]|nr:translation initiation factor IF-1 [Clostridia bacterium]